MKPAHVPHQHLNQGPYHFLTSEVFHVEKDKHFILDREAFGRLRRELFWTVGEKRTHGIFTRYGLTCGQRDALTNGEKGALLQGLGEIKSIPGIQGLDEYVFEVNHSIEASEHLQFFDGDPRHSQCWTVAGYLTGFMSAQLGHPLYFLETHCIGKKDPRCLFVGKSRSAWMEEEEADLRMYDEDNMQIELSHTMDQLRLTKERYQNLYEQSLSPIFIIHPETGVYLNANEAAKELTGYTREELIRMNVFDLFHPKEHHQIASDMKTLMSGGRPPDREMMVVRKDNNTRITAQSSKVLTYGGQRVIQIVVRDVSDLKLSEQKEKVLHDQLLRSERLSSIGRLAAGVAHELKNPLGAIRNAIYYIRNVLAGNPILESDPHLKEILKLAEGEVDGSVIIIEELLDFSRVVNLIPRRTRLNELLESLPNIVMIPPTVTVEWNLDFALPTALLDPDRLNQVFCNIINNAIQAMPSNGKLKISTRHVLEPGGEASEAREWLEVSIEDNGTGIEPVHLTKIFEPLFTTKARGTGLGLAISKNIIEKHGGVILVTSQVGKGTCFIVKLPMKPPPDKGDEL